MQHVVNMATQQSLRSTDVILANSVRQHRLYQKLVLDAAHMVPSLCQMWHIGCSSARVPMLYLLHIRCSSFDT